MAALEWYTSITATEGAPLRRYLTFLCSTGGEEVLTNKRTGSFTIHFPHVLVPSSLDRFFQKGKRTCLEVYRLLRGTRCFFKFLNGCGAIASVTRFGCNDHEEQRGCAISLSLIEGFLVWNPEGSVIFSTPMYMVPMKAIT